MVFQDGAGYKDFVPTVFDNLIAKGEMPVTVGIFIQPGTFANGRSNRSFEYDTLSDQYARFLLEEILPEVEKTTKLRHDAEGRAIAGISSGGICALTVAWERPDEFSKVLSWVGSFTNIASGKTGREGGHNYEAMIRKTPKKPIRVFLQDGSHDLDNNNGNWPLANQQMAKSLDFAKYDYKFVYGEGFHSQPPRPRDPARLAPLALAGHEAGIVVEVIQRRVDAASSQAATIASSNRSSPMSPPPGPWAMIQPRAIGPQPSPARAWPRAPGGAS